MKSLFRMLTLVTLAVGLLLGCKERRTSETAPGAPNAVAQQPATYTLRIAFTGLIGFAQDNTGTVWALLVKANKVDLNDETTLPPGIKKEAQQGGVDLIKELPAHKPWIRVHNADVVTGTFPNPDKGREIAGDLHFVTGIAGPPKAKLSYLSDSGHIQTALGALPFPPDPDELAAVDELEPIFLDTKLDPRLVARVRIDAGTVIGKIDPCSLGNEYSYNIGVSSECPGDGTNQVELAEEVDATLTLPIDKTVTVVIGGDQIELKPKAGSPEIRIEIMNDIEDATTYQDPCSIPHPQPHPLVFRWFYRLLPQSAQQDTSQHYFPCRLDGRQLPPMCPLKSFVVTQKAKP